MMNSFSPPAAMALNELPEEDMLEKMLMSSCERSESAIFSGSFASSGDKDSMKKWGRLGKNIKVAVNAFKQSLSLDGFSKVDSKEQYRKAAWSRMLKSLTSRYPGSQLPEKLISSVRSHFDSLPLSYSMVGYDMEQIFLHMRLLEKAGTSDGYSAFVVVAQEQISEASRCSSASDLSTSSSVCTIEEEECASFAESFKLTFACRPTISRPPLIWALQGAGITMKELQLFDKKCLTLGVVLIQCCKELCKPYKMQLLIQGAVQKSRSMKLNLSLCGLQHSEQDANVSAVADNVVLEFPSTGVHIEPYLLDSSKLQLGETIAMASYGSICKANYDGKMVAAKRLKGSAGFRKDVLALVSCHHKNVLPLLGISMDSKRGVWLVMEYMEGGSLSDAIQNWKKMHLATAIKIAKDITEGMIFLHERGIVHRDLKSSSILLDSKMRAVIGDLDVMNDDQSMESRKYEVGSYPWMAPEVLGTDLESSIITFMTNVYSFGIILWEMITCQTPYSPVKGAVGVAVYGLRPTIPDGCSFQIKHLLEKCWASCPLDRPNFFEILEVLQRLAVKPS